MSDPRKIPPLNETVSDDAPQDAEGWSPYEVWRTQILLPRLEEERQKGAESLIAKDEHENHLARRSLSKLRTRLIFPHETGQPVKPLFQTASVFDGR